jgi:NAD(P)-dependent dehydrogenase (short-subunit alcohol dehydrogenase family)
VRWKPIISARWRCAAPSRLLTNAIRIELRSAGTLVVGVHAGSIDTDVVATVEDAKISTVDVVAQTLNAVEHGDEEVITDDWARGVKESLSGDLTSLYSDLQKQWDAKQWPWKTSTD